MALTEIITQHGLDKELRGDYFVPHAESKPDIRVDIAEAIYKVNKGISTCTIVNMEPNDTKVIFTHTQVRNTSNIGEDLLQILRIRYYCSGRM